MLGTLGTEGLSKSMLFFSLARGIAIFSTSCRPGWLSFPHILKIAPMTSTHWPHQHQGCALRKLKGAQSHETVKSRVANIWLKKLRFSSRPWALQSLIKPKICRSKGWLHPCCPCNTGVSIKIEVASSLDRVIDCINQGPLVPFSMGGRGGESKRVPAQKILKFQSPKNAIFSVLGTKLENKRACFSFKKM